MPLTRRHAIGLLGGAGLLATGRAAATGEGPAGAAISYQLYSSRHFGPLPATLAMLARVGLENVEGGTPPAGDRAALERTRAALAEAGIAMPSSHVDVDALERDPDWVIEVAESIGIAHVYCAWLPPDRRPDDVAGWADFGRRLAAAGRPLRAASIGFGWHNHDFEFAPLPGGEIPLALIFDAGPELEWQADMGWVVRGGADPVAWIDALGPRITSLHVKDVAPPGENPDEGGWADVGAGIVPWSEIMPALAAAPVRTLVLEHDDPGDDERFARVSLAALRALAAG